MKNGGVNTPPFPSNNKLKHEKTKMSKGHFPLTTVI